MKIVLASLILWLAHPPLKTSTVVSVPAWAKTVFHADGPAHDFHVSKCLIEYNEGEKALQISLHMFIDDLEEALRRHGAENLFICTAEEAADAEKHIRRYLEQNFVLEVNGRAAAYAFLGKEISDDQAAVWCYMEIPEVEKLEQLTVTNTLLTEMFDDQKNLVSVFGPDRQRGLLLFQQGKSRESVRFQI